MKKGKTWGEFYSNPAGVFLCVKNIVIHMRYLCIIILRRPRRTLEIGVGIGIQSAFLNYFIKDVMTLDSDKRVIVNAKTTIERSKARVGLVLTDAFSIPFRDRSFDVCHSQGFLEHFTDEELVRLFKEQLRVAKFIVHSVPSDHYPWKQFGNERHLTPRKWHSLLSGCLNGNADLAIKMKYGYFPLINWFVIIEGKPRSAKSDA